MTLVTPDGAGVGGKLTVVENELEHARQVSPVPVPASMPTTQPSLLRRLVTTIFESADR